MVIDFNHFHDLTETEKREASLVLAGIAAAKCNCGGFMWKKPHAPHCAALCGLSTALEALSLKETDEEIS